LSSILKQDQGLIIKQVAPDSPAAKGGLQDYDIIAAFNGQAIFSQQQLTQLIQSAAPKTEVEIGLIRQGKPMTKKVMLDVNPQTNMVQKPMKRSHQMMPQQQFNNNPWQQMPAPFANDPFLIQITLAMA